MYTLGNALNKVKNGLLSGKTSVVVNFTNLTQSVLQVFLDSGYIEDLKVFKEGKLKYIEVFYKDSNTGLSDIKLISKPSRRIYMSLEDLKKQKTKLGTIVVSTPKGVVTKDQAIKAGNGGEVLCKII